MANPQAFLNLLSQSNTRLVGNMFFPDSPGHMITEVDNFLRMRHLGEVDRDVNYLILLRKGVMHIPETIASTYPSVFCPGNMVQIVVDNELARLAQEAMITHPELCVDAGTSHFKLALGSPEARRRGHLLHMPGWPRAYMWVISHRQAYDCSLAYYRRRYESRDFNPLAAIPELTPELREFLGDDGKPLALVHIRNKPRTLGSAANAGTWTNPEALEPSLAYLADSGYKVVKIGRESYPEEWQRYGVLNYSESPLVNYANDMRLLRAAAFVMVNASGFGNLADIIGVPMVYYGVWQINSVVSGRNVVLLPTLMRDRASGRLLKFIEQMRCIQTLPEYWQSGSPPAFPTDRYDERPNTGDELLAATQEAIALRTDWQPRSPLQERFFDLDREYSFAHIEARYSQFFLERFAAALDPGFPE